MFKYAYSRKTSILVWHPYTNIVDKIRRINFFNIILKYTLKIDICTVALCAVRNTLLCRSSDKDVQMCFSCEDSFKVCIEKKRPIILIRFSSVRMNFNSTNYRFSKMQSKTELVQHIWRRSLFPFKYTYKKKKTNTFTSLSDELILRNE